MVTNELSNVTLLLQSLIVTTVYNLDSSRNANYGNIDDKNTGSGGSDENNETSLQSTLFSYFQYNNVTKKENRKDDDDDHNNEERSKNNYNKRKLGWTEVWGNCNHNDDDDDDDNINKQSSSWKQEQEDALSDIPAIVRLLMKQQQEKSNKSDNSEKINDQNDDDDSILILYQHRPAWFEQLLLRIHSIPHVVMNASSLSMESAGPLPVLQDLYPPSKSTKAFNNDKSKIVSPPIMVGRYHPGRGIYYDRVGKNNDGKEEANINSSWNLIDNSILHYLQTQRNIEFDNVTTEEDQKSKKQQIEKDSKTFTHLISNILQPCLLILRYENYENTYDQIYWKQCMDAAATTSRNINGTDIDINITNLGNKQNSHATSNNKNNNIFSTALLLFQIWSEKVMAKKLYINRTIQGRTLLPHTVKSSAILLVENAQKDLKQVYQIFEIQLEKLNISNDNNLQDKEREGSNINGRNSKCYCYLLGTKKPCVVDVLLWDHLADALCNIHSIIILSDFPYLMKFYRHIYNEYFKSNFDDNNNNTKQSTPWISWNNYQNSINAFCQQLPFFGSCSNSNSGNANRNSRNKDTKNYQTAYDLMQSLCLHQNKKNTDNQHEHLKQILSMVKDQNSKNKTDRNSTDQKNKSNTTQNQQQQQQKKLQENQQQQKQKKKLRSQLEKQRLEMEYYDQQWIVMVSGITVFSILLFGMGRK